MKAKPLPPVETLRNLLSYDPETGVVAWRVRPARMSKKRWADNPAAFPNQTSAGYFRGDVDGQTCLAHRVIWKMVHGEEPELIDHVDGDPTNNKLANLRSVGKALNSKNAKLYRNNSSGHAGVVITPYRRFRAYLSHGGKRKGLGTFATLAEAISARDEAKGGLGFTKRHGVA